MPAGKTPTRKARKSARAPRRGVAAAKRLRQSLRRRAVNRSRKSTIKTFTKKAVAAATIGAEDAVKAQQFAQSLIDKAAKGSTLHKRTAARKKSRLMKAINKINAAKAE